MQWALGEALPGLGINCVLDVGGNFGQFGRQLRTLGYAGRIVSFEPSPNALPVLQKVARGDDSWIVRPVGLSGAAGEASLNLHEASVFDSLHVKAVSQPEEHGSFRQTATATVTLSTLAAEYPAAIEGIREPRVLLKSDTQGHDLEVLAGAGGLPAEVAAVLVELSALAIYDEQPFMTRVMDALRAEGFTPVAFEPVNRRPGALWVAEFDGLFVRVPRDGAS
jgi:FkbM family methyltransferase